MAGGRKKKLIFAVLAAMACLVAVLMAVSKDAVIESQVMSDGTVVTIRKVAFGKTHRYDIGPFWQRCVGVFLPAKYRARLRISVIEFTNAANSTVVFIETFKTNGSLTDSRVPSILTRSRVLLTDDIGNKFPMVEGPFVYQSNNFMVESFTSPLVSYEASKMELRITHFSTFTLLEGANPAYFGVRNPAPKTRSLLKPKPTPITNVYDDLVVELLDIRSQIPMPKPWQGRVAPWAATETNFETRAHLRISRNGMPDTTWHPINAAVFDDLGNGYSQSLYYPPGTDGIDVVGGFSPLETRRFRFEFYKDGPFQPDESLKFENVAVPKANGRPLAATNSLRGFAVSYLFVNTNMFNSRITPEPVGYRTYIKIEPAGSNGKLAPIIQGVCMSWQSTGLAIPEGVTAIDITFTISENRYFEFVTRPSSIGTNLGITR